jgi:hypothetical protein
MAVRKTFQQKFQDYEQLKADAHAKVETLTPTQLRKFLAAYRNPGGWNTQQIEPQIAVKEQTQ